MYENRDIYHEVDDETFAKMQTLFHLAKNKESTHRDETDEAIALFDFLDTICCKGGCTDVLGFYYRIYQITHNEKRYWILFDQQNDEFCFERRIEEENNNF